MSKIAATAFAAATVMAATPSYADSSACQKQLEAAVLKMTTSGPMRAVEQQWQGGAVETETTTEFVPPDVVRTTIGGGLYKNLNVKPPAPYVLSGNSNGVPVYEIGELNSFAHPMRYYAIACSGQTITYDYELRGSFDPDFNVRQAARAAEAKKMAAAMTASGQPLPKFQPSVMTLDPEGRPITLLIGSELEKWTYTITYDPSITIVAPK